MAATTPTLASAPESATTLVLIDGTSFAVDAHHDGYGYVMVLHAWAWLLGQWVELDSSELPEPIESRILESILD